MLNSYINSFHFWIGVSSERRNAELKRLNNTYLEVVSDKKTLHDSLDYMVETECYRWICNTTYSLSPKPIRSQRTYEKEPDENVVQDSVIKK